MRGILSYLLPGGRSGRHVTLNFHQVLPDVDPMRPGEMTVERFDRLMAVVSKHFNVIPLVDAVELAKADALPRASLSITFDDGYADNLKHAAPILDKYRLPATFFIATAYLDGGRMWNDTIIETVRRLPEGEVSLDRIGQGNVVLDSMQQRRELARHLISSLKYERDERRNELCSSLAGLVEELPSDLMLTKDELRELHSRQGMDIGGHTRTHPILSRMTLEAATDDIQGGMDDLQAILGEKPALFAYPNGRMSTDYSQEHAEIVQQLGFVGAVSTDTGAMSRTTDFFNIPRFAPWRESALLSLADMVRCRFAG